MKEIQTTFFGDIRTGPRLDKLSSGFKKALIDRAAIHPQGQSGTISICFEAPEESEGGYFTLGTSQVGTNSNYFSNGLGHNCPYIDKETGEQKLTDCNYVSSMVLYLTDPPLENFTWDGTTYELSTFYDEKRRGCYKALNNWTCSPGVVPGSTVIHEFMHALGGLHEHQNVQNRQFEINQEAVINNFCSQYAGSTFENCKRSAIYNWVNCQSINGEECESFSDYDPDSIMQYNVPQKFISSGEDTAKDNYVLSDLDKSWLRSYYPIGSDTKPNITVKFCNGRPWQKDWVKKLVLENIGPNVGINFMFEDSDITLPNGQSVCGSNTRPASGIGTNEIMIIVSIILGTLLGFGLLVYGVRGVLSFLFYHGPAKAVEVVTHGAKQIVPDLKI